MTQLAGRFGFDLEKVWALTQREFHELVLGGLEREREARVGVAMIVQTIYAAHGTRTSIKQILGEDEEEPIDSASPLAGDAKKERYLSVKRALRKKHARWAEKWLPKGVLPASPYSPPERWLPPGIELPRRGDR